jgi:hypothetical protein
MITDACAQVDLIAALHLEALFKMGHLENPSDQSNQVTDSVTAIPHPTEHDSLRLRHRLSVIQSMALRARGLTIKTDMAQEAPTRTIDVVAIINEGGHRLT